MEYKELEKFLSKTKLKPYVLACGDDIEKLIDLFEYNAEISSHMYKIMQIFEISTKNIFNEVLSRKYSSRWLERDEILNGNNRKYFDLINHVKQAKEKFIKNGILFTNDDIVANLSLGFWVKLLFNINSDKIWKPCLKNIFVPYGKTEIQNMFLDIREIRNRIAHHETIFNKNINKTYKNICFLLNIYSPSLAIWTKSYCKFELKDTPRV
jgi:hypothetical protein